MKTPMRRPLLTTIVAISVAAGGCCSGKGAQTGKSAQQASQTTGDGGQAAVGRGRFHSPRLPYPERSIRIGFWLGMSNNEIMTPATIDWIGRRASIVVLNGLEQGPEPTFDYAQIVRRFHDRFPHLPVLLYGWAQRIHDVPRVGGADYPRITAAPGWVMKRSAGEPVIDGRKALIDITVPSYRQFLATSVASKVKRTGTDGIAFDAFYREITGPRWTAEAHADGQRIAREWPAASSAILADVKTALGPDKLVVYNGLFPMWDGLLASQSKLLDRADGAAVEYFGYHVREPKATDGDEFDHYVRSILDIMQSHPDKLFLVFGRSRRYTYLDYREDYLTQRYVLSSFLLGMTPLSTFKYHAHFQARHISPGRSNGMAYYADYDLDLGDPLGPMSVAGGVYQRRFSRGLVAVAPAGHGTCQLRLDRARYTPEGERKEGTLELEPGTGLILLDEASAAPPDHVVIDDFTAGDAGQWRFPVRDGSTTVLEEQGNRYLRLVVDPDALQRYHERQVQPIRSLTAYDHLQLRLRTTDPASALLIRVEVDDAAPVPEHERWRRPDGDGETRPRGRKGQRGAHGPHPFVVLVVRPQSGTARSPARDQDIPYGELRPSNQVPYFELRDSVYRADGRWHDLAINLRTTMRRLAPQFTPHRIPVIRILGRVDLDDMIIRR